MRLPRRCAHHRPRSTACKLINKHQTTASLHPEGSKLTSSETVPIVDVLGERPLAAELLTRVDHEVVQSKGESRDTDFYWTITVRLRIDLTCGIMTVCGCDEGICLCDGGER